MSFNSDEWEDVTPQDDSEWEDVTPAPEKSLLSKAGETIKDGMTNLRDTNIGAAASQLASYPSAAFAGLWSDKPFAERRQEILRQDAQQIADAKERSPITSAITSTVSEIASGPMGIGGIGANALVDTGIVGAGTLARTGDVGEAMKEGGKAGLMSTGLGVGLKGASKLAELAAPAVNRYANKVTVEAFGGSPKLQELTHKNADELGALARERKLVPFGATAEGIADLVDDEVLRVGKRLEDVRQVADDAGAKVDIERLVADKWEELVAGGLSGTREDMAKAYLREIQKKASQISVKEAQDMLSDLSTVFKSNVGGKPTGARQLGQAELYGDARALQNKAVQDAVPEDVFAKYSQDMRDYHLLGGADKASNQAAARAQAAQSIGVKDLMTAGAIYAGGATAGYSQGGDASSALGGMVAAHILRTRGASMKASTADKIARTLQTAPQKLGKYGPILQKAAARGSQSYASTTYMLQKTDPEFRALLEAQQDEENP
jgi:hypothetical protein